jgi:hypothetical protein
MALDIVYYKVMQGKKEYKLFPELLVYSLHTFASAVQIII